MDLGERCKFPQRGLGRNPSRNRIWCILALKYDIWWQLMFTKCYLNREYIHSRLINLGQKVLERNYRPTLATVPSQLLGRMSLLRLCWDPQPVKAGECNECKMMMLLLLLLNSVEIDDDVALLRVTV